MQEFRRNQQRSVVIHDQHEIGGEDHSISNETRVILERNCEPPKDTADKMGTCGEYNGDQERIREVITWDFGFPVRAIECSKKWDIWEILHL